MMWSTFLMLAFGVVLNEGKTCYLNSASTRDGCFKWVLLGADKSECTRIIFGGHYNTIDENAKAAFHNPRLALDAIIRPGGRGKDNISSTDAASDELTKHHTITTQIIDSKAITSDKGTTSNMDVTETTYDMKETSVQANTSYMATSQSSSGCANPVKRTIDDTYTYRFFDIPPSLQRIEFQFRIAMDAHVVLSPHLTSRDVYEVVLGGWSNTKTVIRKCLQGCGQPKIATPYILNSTEFRKFWITFNKENGRIEVGIEHNHDPILTWSDPDPLQINFIGYAKYQNIDAEFLLCDAVDTIVPPCAHNIIYDDCACNGVNGNNEFSSCYCHDGSVLAGKCHWFPEDCYQVRGHGINKSGIYIIQAPRQLPIKVYCDMDTDKGGWTVFQRRVNEDFDFNRDWAGYRSGFGTFNSNFWLGNEKLYHITKNKRYWSRIDMVTNDGQELFATYDNFKIEEESENYRLKSLGTYSGTKDLRNGMACHENMDFSTYDRDNDRDAIRNCANMTFSGWWFNGGPSDTSCLDNKCKEVNLNGKYHPPSIGSAIVWTDDVEILFSEMKIRPYQDLT